MNRLRIYPHQSVIEKFCFKAARLSRKNAEETVVPRTYCLTSRGVIEVGRTAFGILPERGPRVPER